MSFEPNNYPEISNQTAIVTGASRGIGEAISLELARQGARVVLTARSEAKIKDIACRINDSGGQAMAVVCNVGDYESVQNVVRQCEAKYSTPDILINNAGLIDPISHIIDSDPHKWSEVVDVNLKGVYFGIRAVSPLMKKKGKGVIINMSSGAATSSLEAWSHYCATKAAVKSLTSVAHKELSSFGIRVSGLSPGPVATHMMKSIKASGINPVSQIDSKTHLPVEWPAYAISFLVSHKGAQFGGEDFSIKTEEGRRMVGLPLQVGE